MKLKDMEKLLLQEMESVRGGTGGTCDCETAAKATGGECTCQSGAAQYGTPSCNCSTGATMTGGGIFPPVTPTDPIIKCTCQSGAFLK